VLWCLRRPGCFVAPPITSAKSGRLARRSRSGLGKSDDPRYTASHRQKRWPTGTSFAGRGWAPVCASGAVTNIGGAACRSRGAARIERGGSRQEAPYPPRGTGPDQRRRRHRVRGNGSLGISGGNQSRSVRTRTSWSCDRAMRRPCRLPKRSAERCATHELGPACWALNHNGELGTLMCGPPVGTCLPKQFRADSTVFFPLTDTGASPESRLAGDRSPSPRERIPRDVFRAALDGKWHSNTVTVTT